MRELDTPAIDICGAAANTSYAYPQIGAPLSAPLSPNCPKQYLNSTVCQKRWLMKIVSDPSTSDGDA